MNKPFLKAALWGLAVALYLRFGLETTGWLFYEASFGLGVDWLYWGYSAFRGGGYLFGMWPYQSAACIGAGLLVALLVGYRARRKEKL